MKGVRPSSSIKNKKTHHKKEKETRTNLINHIMVVSLAIMLRAADMISSRLPDRFLHFHSSNCTVAFLSRNVVSHPYPSILHTLTPISGFSQGLRHHFQSGGADNLGGYEPDAVAGSRCGR